MRVALNRYRAAERHHEGNVSRRACHQVGLARAAGIAESRWSLTTDGTAREIKVAENKLAITSLKSVGQCWYAGGDWQFKPVRDDRQRMLPKSLSKAIRI